MALLFPDEAPMQALDPSNIKVFSCAALDRHNYAAYPIFSLHKSDAGMITELRSAMKHLDINWREIDLPGVTEPEIGFIVDPWDDMDRLNNYFYKREKEGNNDTVWVQLDAWISNPSITRLPEGVDIPDECLPDIEKCLQRGASRGNGGDSKGSLILLNIITGERVRVKKNFAKKTYKVCGDISGWKYVAFVPDLDGAI